MKTVQSRCGISLSTNQSLLALLAKTAKAQAAALQVTMAQLSQVGEMASSDVSTQQAEFFGRSPVLTVELLRVSMSMLTIFSVEVRMELSEFGHEQTENFSFNLMVSDILINSVIDQKRDIVSLFPDLSKPF